MIAPPLSRSFAVAVLLAGVAACEKVASTQLPSPPPDIAAYVTGAAAAALGPDGRFPPTEPAARERPMISRERAAILALAYVRSSARFLRPSWEEERGGAIRVAGLRADPRVFFAESPYGAFPEGPFHPAFRRGFGPYYVVTLVEGTEPVLLVAVSAFNTDVRVDDRGEIHETPLGGNEFRSAAFPRDGRTYRFLSPEEAVQRVARATGARAAQAPELLLRGGWHPSMAVWKISLDREVPVRGAGSSMRRRTTTLFQDGTGQLLAPTEEQPDAELRDLPVGPPWEPEVRRTMPAHIPIVSGRAVNYDVVVVDMPS